jgi:MYXO-CTERM domain-containing protein
MDEGTTGTWEAVFTDVEAADSHTVGWDFGDGKTGSGTSASHSYADDGIYTITVKVTDDDGGSDSFDLTVAIANVAPTVALSGDFAPDEGVSTTFDPGLTDVGIGDAHICNWSYGDGTFDTLSSGDAVDKIYGADGTYVLSIQCYDDDGASASDTQMVTVSNVAPTITSFAGDADGIEGSPVVYACTASDLGTDDTVTITWDYGDGETATGSPVLHTFVDEGEYTVQCTATDSDGASSTSTMTTTVVNVAPVIEALSVDASADEGDALRFSLTASDVGTADVLTVTWSLGDGTLLEGDSITHSYADNGSYTVKVELDDGTDTVSDSRSITVANVAPSITGEPDMTFVEGGTYTFTPGVDDPGTADTHTWTSVTPGTATVDAGTGALSWTPTWFELGSYAFSITVLDDDGATDTLEWDLEVQLLDEDGDGLSDNWEVLVGLDPTDGSDAATDPDGDGRTSSVEYADGTDPLAYDGPGVPVPLSPADGDEVDHVFVTLVVENATSPVGADLFHQLEIYEDEAMSVLVATSGDLPDDATGMTTWALDFELDENQHYFWWASASDAYTAGDWSDPVSFFHNMENDAPGAPGIHSPLDGASISTTSVVLVVDEAVDPDGDAMRYSIELQDESGAILDAGADLGATDGLAGLVAGATLVDGGFYCWTAFATDEEGLAGEPAEACFTVDVGNEAPSAPEILSPGDGASINTDIALIEVANGVDPEGNATWHIFELDTDPSFGSADFQSGLVASSDGGITSWETGALLDNSMLHVRVACTDGGAVSAWAESSFGVNTTNDAPSVPTLQNPADGAAFADGDGFEIINSTDADGDAISYDFEVRNLNGELIEAAFDVAEDSVGITSWTPAALAPDLYLWTARAVDDIGLASDWASPNGFEVMGLDGDGEDGDRELGGELGGETGKDGVSGCACSQTSGSPARGMAIFIGLVGLLLVRRRP